MAKAPKTPKYRIFELAKELNQESQSIIDFLKKHKVKVANRFSAVGEEIYNLLKENFSRRPKPATETSSDAKAETKTESATKTSTATVKTDAKPNKNSKFDSKHVKPKYESKAKVNARTADAKPATSNVKPVETAPVKKVEEPPKVDAKVDAKIDTKPAKSSQDKSAVKSDVKVDKPAPKVDAKVDSKVDAKVDVKFARQDVKPTPKVEPIRRQDSQSIKPRVDRVERADRTDRVERPSRFERDDRDGGKSSRDSRPARDSQSERDSRPARENRDRSRSERGESRIERVERAERNENRPERGDRTERKNRDSSREDGGKTQNRSRNRRNKNAANVAKSQQQAQIQQQTTTPRLRPKKKVRPQPAPVHKAEIARPTHIKIPSSIAVKDLASKMSCTAMEVMKKLVHSGIMVTINQEVSFDVAEYVASEFGVTAEELPPEVDPTLIPEIEDDPRSLKSRPPVVTVMGHVDHGKTSLLDVIRKSAVTATEAGGITQHIGAYQVMCNDRKIVFLDTPGHEAFTAMRARGAQVTDIAILVVAADDGVMPQTVEAINHAKAAGVPIIVAINKIDKPGANPMKVKQELMEYELVSDDYGGNTVMVEVSAKKNIGINDLLEMILLVADMQELKANPNCDARGVIIEAQLDRGRGSVATVLVQKGTLRIGDYVVAGTTSGRVRAMINDRGDNVKKAGPSVPVEVLGLNDVPAAGDILAALDEKTAKSIAEHRLAAQRNDLIKSKKVSLDDLFTQIKAGKIKDLNILVKADVQGSVEALSSSLVALNEKNEEVHVKIIHSGVGAVNESDIMLASSANALIIAFNVRPDNNARRMADTENVDVRTYRVIYDAIGDVKAAMTGMLAPKYKEVIQGRVEIRKVMKFSKALVAGSYVLEGKIQNNSKIRLLRDNVEIFDGEIDSLRRFKDEVKEVAAGYECGISIIDFRDFKEGDIIEAYTMEEIAPKLEI
ncbi:MAG: translation initiation factor IF-2 [Selenomonadaceae bacterium]|nr:translation initiation factor IF-2 [Selenomonadaceae bacterium]